MKRIWFFLGLFIASALLGGALYAALRPVRSEDERKMDWLADRLGLSAEQRTKIWQLHVRHCPQIGKLGVECSVATPGARQQCRQATEQLVRAVSAELTPEQRERYLKLVASCLESSASAPDCR